MSVVVPPSQRCYMSFNEITRAVSFIGSQTHIPPHCPAPTLKSSLKLRWHLGVGPVFTRPEPYIIWKHFEKENIK